MSLALLRLAPVAGAAPFPAPPQLRLGTDVRPSAYAVELWVVPEQEEFKGEVAIELELAREVPGLWLHGHGLKVTKAELTQAGGSIAASPLYEGQEFLGFRFEKPVRPGQARLQIRYQGTMPDRDAAGLFRRKEAGRWYAATQLESTWARRVFPCFDEPGFKVPWRLTLHVPRAEVALANTPVLSETPEPDGLKCVRFAPTRPLPSYLVALAVGPFEMVELGKVGRRQTPVRIFTTRGRTAQTAFAARALPELLRQLEDYYGIPYPYEKLDHLALPQFDGAMENAGLIVYADTLLLAPPGRETMAFKRTCPDLAAHEMAHQWFGNLVTMAWWDDLWLNEAFASWMSPKMVQAWQPGWRVDLDQLDAIATAAIGPDSLLSARCIRQPIRAEPDIDNAFDAITYTKGAAVLGMFEAWLGPEAFRRGVRSYLESHAWGNATTADFLKALNQAAATDVGSAFASFLDQPGIPLISVTQPAEAGLLLQLTQRRFLPLGSAGATNGTWRIPLRGRYAIHGQTGQCRRLLVQPQETLRLDGKSGSLDWVQLNQDAAGYYLVTYPGPLLTRLLDQGLLSATPAERLGILHGLAAAVKAGDLPLGEAARLQSRLLRGPDVRVVAAAADFLGRLSEWVPDTSKARFRRFIGEAVRPLLKEISWEAPPHETEDARLLRLALLHLLAWEGEDARLIDQARQLAPAWLTDRQALAPDSVEIVLALAARGAEPAFYQRLLAQAIREPDSGDRQSLLNALGSCAEPRLAQRALEAVVAKQFQPADAVTLLFRLASHAETRLFLYQYLKNHFAAVTAALPTEWFGEALPTIAQGFADPGLRDDVREFFKDKDVKLTGGPRILAQVVESINLNAAFKRAQQPSLVEFLAAAPERQPPAR